jgi:hypothetical protein
MQLLAEEPSQSLQDRISFLETTIARLMEENAAMAATQAHFIENQEIQLKLINDLRHASIKEPQPMQRDRAEILHALLAANGGKMLAKAARQKMGMDKASFSRLLKVCDIGTKPYHLDKRQLVIFIK